MPLVEFEGCRQRIRRAKAHREDIAKLWNRAASKEDFYSVGLNMNDDGTGSITISPNYGWEFTNAIALHLGEMLYQLRAALDSAVYGAAIRESGEDPPPMKINGNSPSASADVIIDHSTERH